MHFLWQTETERMVRGCVMHLFTVCLLLSLMFPAKAAAHHTNSTACLSPLSTNMHHPVLLPAVHTVLDDQRAVQRLVVL